ncbi:hypothetical protein AHAS_Ahas02G0167600 [Arachis hypogaea]
MATHRFCIMVFTSSWKVLVSLDSSKSIASRFSILDSLSSRGGCATRSGMTFVGN